MGLAHPDDIVAALVGYGLTVVEHPGWRHRGTAHPFDPFAQLYHHDALTEKVTDARALAIMVEGRPDLTGPLCNGWIDSDARVVLVAYGNANHAGRGEADVLALLKAGQPPLGDARQDPDKDGPVGNPHLWGWECRNAGDGRDVWEQLAAMETAGAALAEVCGWSPMAIAAHREWTARKPDPAGIDMHRFRADVARILEHHQETDMPPAPGIVHDADGDRWLFVRGTDGGLYGIDENGGQHNFGGVITSGPTASLAPNGDLEVSARGTDGATWVYIIRAGERVDLFSAGGQS